MSKDLLTKAKNLKLQYHKSSKLTPDVFNSLVDLILSNLVVANSGETAVSIRNKLQTLFGDDRLDVSAIKNLTTDTGEPFAAETPESIRDKLSELVAFDRLDASAIKNLIAANITYATSESSVVSLQTIIDQILAVSSIVIKTGDGNKFLNDHGDYVFINWSVIEGKPTKTSDFINDGEDGSSPFVTQTELETALSVTSNDKNYLHIQGVPSDTWVITHNMNKMPTVVVIDSAGTCVEGSVQYSLSNPLNELTITFNGSFSGKASLN